MSLIQCSFRWTSIDFFDQVLWLIMAFISLFIYYLYFILFIYLKKNRGKKQHSNALQPHSLCFWSTRLLIEIQSSELYNIRILNKENFKWLIVNCWHWQELIYCELMGEVLFQSMLFYSNEKKKHEFFNFLEDRNHNWNNYINRKLADLITE